MQIKGGLASLAIYCIHIIAMRYFLGPAESENLELQREFVKKGSCLNKICFLRQAQIEDYINFLRLFCLFLQSMCIFSNLLPIFHHFFLSSAVRSAFFTPHTRMASFATENSIAHKLQICRSRPMQSFRAACQPSADGISFNYRDSDASIFILFFPCRVESSEYLLLRWCSRGHDILCQHCTLPVTKICANFFIHFVDLTLVNILEDGSTILRRHVPNFTHSIFSIPRLLPTSSEIYSAFVAV